MKSLVMCALGLLVWASVATAQDVCGPSKINDVTGDAGKTTAYVSWTNSGDDCNTGTATSYEIRRSTSNITDTNWQSASVVATGTPGGNGTNTCVNFDGLQCNTTYYWVVFLIDEAGNRSPFSNVFQKATAGCGTILEVAC